MSLLTDTEYRSALNKRPKQGGRPKDSRVDEFLVSRRDGLRMLR